MSTGRSDILRPTFFVSGPAEESRVFVKNYLRIADSFVRSFVGDAQMFVSDESVTCW